MKNNPCSNNQWASSFFETEEAADTLPRFTDHTYHNYSTYIEHGGKMEKHKKCEQNFPARLHAMLSNEKYSHIISWMPHGRAWKVLDKKLLVEEAIPNYFGQSKYASFTRQLNGWGFKRLYQTGPDFGCYYHQCFLRGHPQLTILMRRISPGQGKTTKNVQEEPDFYMIAEQFPLEKSADVNEKDKEQVLKKADAPFSGNHQTEYLGGKSSENGDEDIPLVPRKAAATDTESMSTHRWDPFCERDSTNPPHREEADHEASLYYQNDGNIPTYPTNFSSHSHSFANAGTTKAKKEDEDQAELTVKEAMNHDSLPASNYQLASHCGSLHAAHHEVGLNTYHSSINQYAAGSSHQAAAAAAGYYCPQPQHSQQHYANNNNMLNYGYWYRDPDHSYSNYHSAQGLVQGQGHAQLQSANTAQLNYPAQGFHNHNTPLPGFSPSKPSFKEYEEESIVAKPPN